VKIVATRSEIVAVLRLIGSKYPLCKTCASLIDKYVSVDTEIHVSKSPVKASVAVNAVDGTLELNIKSITLLGCGLFGVPRVIAAQYLMKAVNGFPPFKAVKVNGNVRLSYPGVTVNDVVCVGLLTLDVGVNGR